MRLLILTCLILLPSICFGGWWIPVFVGGVEESGSTAYYGSTVDTSGVPTDIAISNYGVNTATVTCTPITATADLTIEAMNIYHGTGSWGADSYGLVYNELTLVAKTSSLSSTATSTWSGYISLAVESGQSLSVNSGDELMICVATSGAGSNSLGSYVDPGGVIHYNNATWDGSNPPTDYTGYSTSGTTGLGVVLRYEY